jgi:hypothetical protein
MKLEINVIVAIATAVAMLLLDLLARPLPLQKPPRCGMYTGLLDVAHLRVARRSE